MGSHCTGASAPAARSHAGASLRRLFGRWHIPTSPSNVPPNLPQNIVLFILVWALPTESEPLKDIAAIAQLQYLRFQETRGHTSPLDVIPTY